MFVKCKSISKEHFRQILISSFFSRKTNTCIRLNIGRKLEKKKKKKKKKEQACSVFILFSKERNKPYNSNYQLILEKKIEPFYDQWTPLSLTCKLQLKTDNDNITEPQHDKTNKMAFVHSDDSAQPAHLPSPICVFAVRSIVN